MKPFGVPETYNEAVIKELNEFMAEQQHKGHDDVEIHTKFLSTLSGMNVTVDTDGRSADITTSDYCFKKLHRLKRFVRATVATSHN